MDFQEKFAFWSQSTIGDYLEQKGTPEALEAFQEDFNASIEGRWADHSPKYSENSLHRLEIDSHCGRTIFLLIHKAEELQQFLMEPDSIRKLWTMILHESMVIFYG